MECQVEKLENFWYIEFSRGTKAVEAARNIFAVYGDNAIGESMARKWFSRLKEDRCDISDTPRSERLSGFHEDRLNTLIHNDTLQCTRELANEMNGDHSTIVRHLHSMGKVQKIGCMGTTWFQPKPQKSAGGHMCISVSCHLLTHEQHRPSLPCIVTGDEKWCLYTNIRKIKEWLNLNNRRICRKCSNFSIWHYIF